MSRTITELRPFVPGTTGWTAADLDDPEIERQWVDGRYEIINGVLTMMAPACFDGSEPVELLIYLIYSHITPKAGRFATEVDIIMDDDRVIRADAAFLTPGQKEQQRQAARKAGRKDVRRARILIPPTLIVESISVGHEQHDEKTKRRWYAEFGVPNYWLLNSFKRTLKCLVLRDGVYREDVAGHDDEEIQPSLFPGLVLRLAEIWPM